MNSERVKQIVSEAFEVSAEQREAFVRKACGNDKELLLEVLSLIDAACNAEQAGFLPSAASAGALDARASANDQIKTAAATHRSSLDSPEQFGRYKVLERIGEGGMGIVYRAEQRVPMRREVVVKVIKLGMDTKLVIARFEAERQALAMMDHPHIAKVYDAGTDDHGRPYFVMEYVKGTPIVDYCDRNQLSVKERLELFTQVCQAIQHAHHKGIIHRDIKPSNILVSTQDSKPFAKVIDFGIAKATSQRLTDRTLFTEHANMIGTPAYMSPEQADGNIDIDTRTDVYSLGVVLYELLTGRTPFDTQRLKNAALNEVARIIREEDPPKPSTRVSTLVTRQLSRTSSTSKSGTGGDSANGQPSVQTLATIAKARGATAEAFCKSLRGEVDWIVMKALEKTRARRYETPNALADDIERFLKGEQILAAPPTLMYRMQKFSTRYKAAIATVGAFVIVLFLAAIGTSFGLIQARSALHAAEKSRTQAQIAGDEAANQAKLAITAKLNADQQAKRAQKAALLAEARYLIQQAELPEAMNLLMQADQIGLSNDERLELNELLKASRGQWTLLARIPTGTRPSAAAVVTTPDAGTFIAGSNGARIFSQKIAANIPAETMDLDTRPAQLLVQRKPGDRFIAVCANKLNLLTVHPLQKIKSRTFPHVIRVADTSLDSVLILQDDGTISLLDAQTLEDRQTWNWRDLKQLSPKAGFPRVCTLSTDDRFIVIHAGAWNIPTVVIDRSNSTSYACIMRMGNVSFDPHRPTTCLTWFSPGRNGGLTDELCAYDLANGGRELEMIGLENQDTRDVVEFKPVNQGLVMFGAVGTIHRDEYSGDSGVRYQAMWPFTEGDANFLTSSDDGSMLLLSTTSELLVFTNQDNSVIESRIDDWSSCASADGVFSFDWKNRLHYQPFSFTEKPLILQLQLLEKTETDHWYPWGMTVTPDAKHLAVLDQCSNGFNTITDTYGTRKLLLYDASAGLDQPQSWKISKQIDIPDFDGVSGFNNRLVRLSPDAASVIIGMTDGQVERFDCASGEQRDKLKFQRNFEVSPDGTYLAGVPTPGRDLQIYRISDGSLVTTIKDITNNSGGCFSDDNKMFMLSRGGKKIDAFDLSNASLMWSKNSSLIPRAWCAATHRFLGMLPEKTGTGSKLILADVDTAKPVADISPFADHRNDMAFHKNGSVIYFQRDRWDFEITRFLQSSELTSALKTPAIATPDVSAYIAPIPAALPVAATGAMDARDIEKLSRFASKEVVLTGDAVKAEPTASGGHLNILLDPSDSGVMLFIRNKTLKAFDEASNGDFAAAVLGRKVLVKGTLGQYGGYSESFKGRFEIELTDPSQLQILDAAPATQPAH